MDISNNISLLTFITGSPSGCYPARKLSTRGVVKQHSGGQIYIVLAFNIVTSATSVVTGIDQVFMTRIPS